MLYCSDCSISGGRAKEQSEELIYILGKIHLILGFVQVLNLSLGIVAACLLWCQFIEILANTGDSRWKELKCVVFLTLLFFSLQGKSETLSCGSENFSSHSHTALNKSSCHLGFS